MLLRHRTWLALATTLVALASCDLNPQPVLPADRVASEPMLNGGTTALDPAGPDNGDDSGKGGRASAGSSAMGQPLGGAPSDGEGGDNAGGQSAGGESASGAGGESTDAAGDNAGGQGAGGGAKQE